MLAHEPVAMWEVLFTCYYRICSVLSARRQVIKVVIQVCSSHWLVTPVPLLSLFPRVVPFRRPELGVYCVGVHLLIRISSKHPAPV